MKHHKQKGSVLVIVLLLGIIVMGGVITMASTSMLSARTSSTDERKASAATFAAEAGINTFAARVQLGNYLGKPENLDCWIQGSRAPGNTTAAACTTTTPNLADYTLANGSETFTVSVKSVAYSKTRGVMTLQSIATSGQSSKTILQDFMVKRPPTTNISLPGALTSGPKIDLGGNGTLVGSPWDLSKGSPTFPGDINLNGVVSLTTLTQPFSMSGTKEMTVDDDSLLAPSSYVRVNGNTYRLDDYTTSDKTFKVTQLTGTTSGSASTGASVDLVQFAVSGTPSQITSTTARIPVSDITGFFDGDVIYMGSGSKMYSAEVVSSGYTTEGDYTSGYLNIKYTTSKQGSEYATNIDQTAVNALKEGMGITRYVPGAASPNGLSKSGSAQLYPAPANAGDPNPSVAQGETALFQQIFDGKTKAQIYELSNKFSVVPNYITEGINWLEPAGYTQGTTDTNQSFTINNLCGAGVLIVNYNLTINGTCDKTQGGFTGLIYVLGDLNNQGNSYINGGVAVEGVVSTSGTKVKGTMDIQYDPSVFLKRGRGLSQLIPTPVVGTWRQQ